MASRPSHDMARRQRRPELMDELGLDPRRHAAALRGLERINVLSRTADALLPALRRLAERTQSGELRILDVACGGGDMAVRLARSAGRAGLRVHVDGCDLSPTAVEHSRSRAAAAGLEMRFFTHDALGNRFPDGYDVLMSTLFLHHLDETDAVALLGNMREAARLGVLVDDLIRSRMGYTLAWLGCRLVTTSHIVHHDGPVSVEAAFSLDEIRELAGRAGLEDARLQRHWPERFLLEWARP